MTDYQMTLVRSPLTIRKDVYVQPTGRVRPTGGTNLESFEHNEEPVTNTETVEAGAVDLEVASLNHVIYHHVQDALYRVGVEDMHTVDIHILAGDYVNPPTNTALPAITGTPQVGVELTLGNGTWTGSPTFTYKWLFSETADGTFTEVAGATSNKFTPDVDHEDGFLRGEVSGTNAGGTVTVQSAVTAAVAAE